MSRVSLPDWFTSQALPFDFQAAMAKSAEAESMKLQAEIKQQQLADIQQQQNLRKSIADYFKPAEADPDFMGPVEQKMPTMKEILQKTAELAIQQGDIDTALKSQQALTSMEKVNPLEDVGMKVLGNDPQAGLEILRAAGVKVPEGLTFAPKRTVSGGIVYDENKNIVRDDRREPKGAKGPDLDTETVTEYVLGPDGEIIGKKTSKQRKGSGPGPVPETEKKKEAPKSPGLVDRITNYFSGSEKQAGGMEVDTDKTGKKWQIVRDSSNRVVGRKPL